MHQLPRPPRREVTRFPSCPAAPLRLSLALALTLAAPVAAHEGDGEPAGSAAGPALSDVPCVDGSAAGFPCRNVDLRAYVPVAELGTTQLNDVWGWRDPVTGVEYALVGSYEGVLFVSLEDPSQPLLVGELPSPTTPSVWGDIRVHADHAFSVKESSGHGLQVFDLTRLRSVTDPPVVFAQDARYTGFGKAHNVATNPSTGLGVAVGSNTCSGGLHLVDLDAPLAPAFLGCFAADGYTHDVQCVAYHGPDLAYSGHEICFGSNTDTLTIVDVSDPAAPVQLARVSYPGVGYVHQGGLTADQRYFLQDDELDEYDFGHAMRTYVWDVSDLDAPVWRGYHAHATTAIDHNLFVFGEHVYQAAYRAGLRVLRTGRLVDAEMAEVAFFDTFPLDDAADFSGAWGVYRFASGLAAVTDLYGGLFVLEPHPEAVAQCADTIDNDGDGRVDAAGGPNGEPADSGCFGPGDAVEGSPVPAGGCGLGPELLPLLAGLAALRSARRRACA